MISVLGLGLVTAQGCQVPATERPPADPPPQTPHEPGEPEAPVISPEHYEGPPVEVRVDPRPADPDLTVVRVSVIAPTGGHRLVRDHTVIEAGAARLFYTLERPASDEAVTMALVELTDRFETSFARVHAARVYLNVIERGQPMLEADYRKAAETEPRP